MEFLLGFYICRLTLYNTACVCNDMPVRACICCTVLPCNSRVPAWHCTCASAVCAHVRHECGCMRVRACVHARASMYSTVPACACMRVCLLCCSAPYCIYCTWAGACHELDNEYCTIGCAILYCTALYCTVLYCMCVCARASMFWTCVRLCA